MGEYTKTIQSNGKSEKIAANIADIFIHRGYLIETKNRHCIELKQAVKANRNNDPLMAVSHISIEIRQTEVCVNADLSAFDMVYRILTIMFAVMALMFFILFCFFLKVPFESALMRFAFPVLPFAPWPILLPLMKRFTKNRCAKMLDIVIQNSTMID